MPWKNLPPMGSSTPEIPAQPTFEDFRNRPRDESLSNFGRIGFPDSYRAGKEERIFADIRAKLPTLDASRKTVLDIGPGCSVPATMMIDLCRRHKHQLILVDSEEMLAHLP